MSGTNGNGSGGNGYGRLSDEEKLKLLHDRREDQRRKEEAARRAAAARRRIESSARGRAAVDTESEYSSGRTRSGSGQSARDVRGSVSYSSGTRPGGRGSYAGRGASDRGYSRNTSGHRYPEHRGLREEEDSLEVPGDVRSVSAVSAGSGRRGRGKASSKAGEAHASGENGRSQKTGRSRKVFGRIKNPFSKMPLKIRRTIRLSTAGVLAVSAIVVAAIPGNSLRAAGGEAEYTEYSLAGDYPYKVEDDRTTSGTPVYGEDGNEEKDSSYSAGTYYKKVNDAALSLYHQDRNKSDVHQSYKIDAENKMSYNFDYYVASGIGGVICDYNSSKVRGEVTVDSSNFPTQFIDSDFDNSLSANYVTDAIIQSNKTYLFNYDVWVLSNRPTAETVFQNVPTDSTVSANFVQRYYNETFRTLVGYYSAYDDAASIDPTVPKSAYQADSFIEVSAQSLSSADCRNNWYLDFYLGYEKKTPIKYGSGLTMKEVEKTPKGSSSYKTVNVLYSPKSTGMNVSDQTLLSPNGGVVLGGYKTDYLNDYYESYEGVPTYGFVYDNSEGTNIVAIGDYAFYNTSGIDKLHLVGFEYIGDYAFANSSVLQEVDLKDVKRLGNAAFRNCTRLVKADPGSISLLTMVGAEAFYGTNISGFTFVDSLDSLGAGSFARLINGGFKTVDFTLKKKENFEIGDYAFYDDYGIGSVLFEETSPVNWSIGDCAFAINRSEADPERVTAADSPMAIDFPPKVDFGEWILAGRQNLTEALMPENYGTSATRLPVSTFIDCTNLGRVLFPQGTGYICLNPYTFYDVENPLFYVEGPEFSSGTKPAMQREDMWMAEDHNGNSIPYKMLGSDVYEALSIENDNLVLQFDRGEADATLSLVFQRTSHSSQKSGVPHIAPSGSDPDMTLAIPSSVASYPIVRIGDGTKCVIDTSMLSLTNKVTKVKVPSSVGEIGAGAFKGTDYVNQIDFAKGEGNVAVGDEAFFIGDAADGLLINGRIDSSYGPFAYAAEGKTINKKASPTHICYRGNNSSDMGLVTIYDSDSAGMTLVDYPKVFELDREYADEMTEWWYDYYLNGSGGNIGKNGRERFLENYLVGYSENGRINTVTKFDFDYNVAGDSGSYGPWINEAFCDEFPVEVLKHIDEKYPEWQKNWDETAGTMPSKDEVMNQATGVTSPDPYFLKHPYSIVEKVLGTPSTNPWEQNGSINDTEYALIRECSELTIPDAISSIDVAEFIDNNSDVGGGDATAYLNPDTSIYTDPSFLSNGTKTLSYKDKGGNTVSYTPDEWKMYRDISVASTLSADGVGLTPTERSTEINWKGRPPVDYSWPWQGRKNRDIQPGLFSGYYEDASDKSGDSQYGRGNDDLTKISARGLKYLPPYAFDSCENLTTLELGDLTEVGDSDAPNYHKGFGVFRGCYDLNTGGISLAGNSNFKLDAKLNALMSADGSTLYAGVPGSAGGIDLSGNSTIKAIMEGAYEDCPNVNSVNLSKTNITTIPAFAFSDCPNLGRFTQGKSKDVKFPSGLNRVLNYAFNGDFGVSFYVPSNTTRFDDYAIEGGLTNKDYKPAHNWFVLPDTYLKVADDGVTVTGADFDNSSPASYAWNDLIDSETGRHIGLYPNTGITITLEDMDPEKTTVLAVIAIDQDDMQMDGDGNWFYDLSLNQAQALVKAEIDKAAQDGKVSPAMVKYYEDLKNYFVRSSVDSEDVERVNADIPEQAGALDSDKWNLRLYGDTVLKGIEKEDYRTVYIQFTGAKSGAIINFNMNVKLGRKPTLTELIKEYDAANGTDYFSEIPEGAEWTLTYSPVSAEPEPQSDNREKEPITISKRVEIDATEEGSSMTFYIGSSSDAYEVTFSDGTGNNTTGYPFKHTYQKSGTIIPSNEVQFLGYAVPAGTKSWHASTTGKYYSLTAQIIIVNGMTITASTHEPNSEGDDPEPTPPTPESDHYTITFRTYDMQAVLRTVTKPKPKDGSSVTLSNNDLAFYYNSSGTAKYYPRYIVYEPDQDSGKYFTAASSAGAPVYEVIDDTKILCYLKEGKDSSGSKKSSSSGSSTKKYKVTVNKGTVDGSKSTAEYESGKTVTIIANAPETGMAFQKWQVDSGDIKLANETSASTTFTMPSSDVTVTAVYTSSINANRNAVTPAATPTTGGSTGGGSTGGTRSPAATPTSMVTPVNPNVNTAQVIVSKPGIDNVGLASAVVHGTDQSIIVRVSQTNEATFAAENALKWKYGDDCLDSGRIVDWPFDLSLYDASGEHKLENTDGITVDLTLPLPNDLKQYGGNNMAGAVAPADGTLETLGTKFNSVNGTPVVTFTAMHFSPYVLYADTQNLDARLMDVTPQTGDPLSLKWILVIGLGAASAFLFLKKEKAPAGAAAA